MSSRRSVLFSVALLILVAALASACSASALPTPAPTPTSVPQSTGATEAPPVNAGGLRTFVIVSGQSTASYVADEEFLADMLPKYGINVGKQDTVGITPAVEGQIELDLGNLAAALGDNRFHADLSQLASDQSLRDKWIRDNGPEFATYPDADFVATAIEGAPASYVEGDEVSFRLLGDLTIHEITQPVAFDVTAKLDGGTLSGFATAAAVMSDFGIEPPNFANTLTVKDEFTIRVDFVAQEQ